MPLLITLSFKLSFERREEREKVIKLMRLQSSAIRFIYNRLKEGKTDNEIYKLTQEKFNSLPAWNINSALRKAKQYPTDKGTDRRNSERGRVAKTILQSDWQVLRVAVPFPILGKVLPRDLSPLKPMLVEGVLDRSQEHVSSCRSCRGRELNN
jgi:predicted transposase